MNSVNRFTAPASQLGPDQLPVIGSEHLSGNYPSSDRLNGLTVTDWHAPSGLLPLPSSSLGHAQPLSKLAKRPCIACSDVNWMRHARKSSISRQIEQVFLTHVGLENLYDQAMQVKDWIKAARKTKDWTQSQLGDAVGRTKANVGHWEAGKHEPKLDTLEAIANSTGYPLALLGIGSKNVEAGPDIAGVVPLLSDVQAGDFKEIVDNFQEGDDLEMVATAVQVHRYTFALRVTGESMLPEFHPGMVLIVEPEMEAMPGDFVIAKNGEHEVTFKQLIKEDGIYFLKPLNERFPIRPLGSAKIIGIVRAVERRFR